MSQENRNKMSLPIECSLGHSAISIVSNVKMMTFGGQTESVPQQCYHCNECGEEWIEGELDVANRQEIEKARALSGCTSAAESLRHIQEFHGIPLVRLETAFGLPCRITSKWKSAEKDQVNSAAVALLNLVKLYPFLVEVAEASYGRAVADVAVLSYTAQICSRASYHLLASHPEVTSTFCMVGGGATKAQTG